MAFPVIYITSSYKKTIFFLFPERKKDMRTMISRSGDWSLTPIDFILKKHGWK